MKHVLSILAFLLLIPCSGMQAQRQYPGIQQVPDEVIWKREVYRSLDLLQSNNGALYHPAEPQDGKANLFTMIFKLMAQQKIKAYEYTLDGLEHFTEKHEVNFRDIMDRYGIYYEMRAQKGRRDSIISIHNSDIPSAEVQTFFIKEVWYYDQRTATQGTQVVALCPVLNRTENYTNERANLPMCWIKMEDLMPFLTQETALSNLNSASNRTLSDFFAQRLYQGDIYKVANLQNLSLTQYCHTEEELHREQQRIENELLAFGKMLHAREDSIKAQTATATGNVKSKGKSGQTRTKAPATTKTTKAKSTSSKQNSGSKRELAAPKTSVRRERR